MGDTARMRVIFLARPADETPPKQMSDEHTLEVRWVTLEELRSLPLRGSEVEGLLEDVLAGAPVFPLGVLGAEGEPLLPCGRQRGVQTLAVGVGVIGAIGATGLTGSIGSIAPMQLVGSMDRPQRVAP